MQGPQRIARWGAPWAGALPSRAALAAVAGLSALLWAAIVRVVTWLVAGT